MAVALGTAERREWTVPPPEAAMWRHQAALPLLPVPDLGQTCVRYLRSVRPLLNDAEFEKTLAAVAAFAVGGQGEELQRRLRARRGEKCGSSWLADWWNHLAYLSDPGPVVFFVSYFYSFKRLTALPASPEMLAGGLLQCAVAAALVDAALGFKDKIDDGSLEPDKLGGVPQCMSAYPFLFNSCRIPSLPSDKVVVHHVARAETRVLVARRGRLYTVTTHNAAGQRLTQPELAAALCAVVRAADAAGDATLPLGALTSGKRAEWAAARELLCTSPSNASAFLELERAALMVCLDSHCPAHVGEAGAGERARQMWHGDGVNRFYDKTLQLIVLPDGNAGFLGEHSLADGAPTLRMFNDVLPAARHALAAASDAGLLQHPLLPHTTNCVREIVLEGVERVGASLREARAAFEAQVVGHQTARVALKGLGSDAIKKLGVAPDAFCQLAMQVAFCRMHGRVAATYEACATRRFLHGRTETIRSCSIESTRLSHAMAADTPPTPAQALVLLKKAADQHRSYSQESSIGMGIDRHLLGLKLLLKPGEKMPAIFTDKAFALSGTWELSTSHLPSEHLETWGFGEVAPEGFGCGYSCNRAESAFFVSCRVLPGAKWPQRAQAFADAIERAMQDIAHVCSAARVSKL